MIEGMAGRFVEEAVAQEAAEAPPAGWATGPLGQAQAADREIARQTALRARAIADFAATRPASADRAQGEPGAMSAERWAARPDVLRDVSEWAAQEVVIGLSITAQAAEALIERSLTLVHRLPATLGALEAGRLHVGHLWPLLEHVAPITDPRLRAEVEEELLAWMVGRVATPAQLGAKTRRLVLARNARDASRRLTAALRERGVHLRPERTPGMASVTAVMTMPEALALVRALGAYADAVDDEPGEDGQVPRTRGQKMVDCLLDLVLRPGDGDLTPVQVLLTVVASLSTLLGGDEPGEIDGHVVPAEVVRDFVRAVTGRFRGSEPDDARAADDPPTEGGSAETTVDGRSVLACHDEELANWWDEVERRVLAGDLPGEPDPLPDEVLRRWAEEAPPDVRSRTPGGPAAGAAATPAAAGDAPAAPDDSDPGGSVAGEGWWSIADRAVEAAGAALRPAQQALGHARRMVRTAQLADAADEEAWQAGVGGRVDAAADAIGALQAATAAQRQELADLLDATAGGGLADRPRVALVDALSGTFVALSDLPALRRAGTCGAPACRRDPGSCTHDLRGRPGLGPPGPTDGYRPGRELDRWVRARDRRCRFPGCRRRVPKGGELDHHVPHPLGPTSAGNLAGYCTGNHRGKHQAPGWHYELAVDGTITVATPSGLTISESPPPY